MFESCAVIALSGCERRDIDDCCLVVNCKLQEKLALTTTTKRRTRTMGRYFQLRCECHVTLRCDSVNTCSCDSLIIVWYQIIANNNVCGE